MQPSEEIKAKLDIVDFIKDYIPLQAAGMNFRARCPFHNEKTPSFMVSPDKQIWHCFGCGKGGDIFKFLMELEGIEFVEALRILAPKAGVVLKRQNPKEVSAKMRMLDILDISRRYYHKYFIEAPSAKPARDYLVKRGLDDETIDEWQIGASPNAWDGLLKVLKKQGYREPEIEKTGMIIHNQQKNSYYDRFRGRIMFPINDANGNVVAFSARVSPEREETETMGKYINSPQTTLYNKSQIIFGLDKAKQAIKQHDQVIIVEGQMDVITAHQHGYKNVVASSGTALTKEQITMLKRFTANFAMAFDMDDAGHMAADRGIREALKQDINIKVIQVPEGKDPDECIKNNKDDWELAVKDAKHMMDYYFERTFKTFDISGIDGRRKSAAKLLPIIANIENPIEKSYWLKSLSESLSVDESVLKEAMHKNRPEPIKSSQQYESRPRDNESYQKMTRDEYNGELFIAILFRFPFLIDFAVKNMSPEYFLSHRLSSIYKNLLMYYNNGTKASDEYNANKSFNISDFTTWLEKSQESVVADKTKNSKSEAHDFDQLQYLNKLVLLGDKEYYELDESTAKLELIRIIMELKKFYILKRMKELESGIAKAENEKNEAAIKTYLEELRVLTDELRDLSK